VTSPRFHGFADVVRLPAEGVTRLLRHGEPQERVWAAWTLGLRLGADAAPLVSQSLSSDPSAGARRHFLVVLAGAGAVEAVRALADADPDEEVRATGLQYLARLTSPTDADLQAVLASRLADEPSTDARIVLLQYLRDDAAPEVRRAAESLAGAAPLALRTAVAKRLLEWRRPAERFPLALVARAPLETDAPLRRRLLAAWWEVEGGAQVVEAARDFPFEAAADVLDLAAARAMKLPWAALEPLARRADPRLRPRLEALVAAHLTEPEGDWPSALKAAGRRGRSV